MVLYDWISTWTGSCTVYWMHVVLEQHGVRFEGEDETLFTNGTLIFVSRNQYE